MAILLKVNWVDESDQLGLHQRIRHIGGISRELQWQHTQAQAIEAIERGLFSYYVETDNRALQLEVARTDGGDKYLTVQAGDGHARLLAELPRKPDSEPGSDFSECSS